MENPILTIMMPSYNYARYLRESIESILSQDFTDFEFLIIDDGSTDGSADIIREYEKQDPRIRAQLYPKNAGMLERINASASLFRGKYVHYLAADDYRYQGFLKQCMEMLLSHPDLGMCCTQFHYGDEKELLLETSGFVTGETPTILKPPSMVDAFLNRNLKLFSVATIYKTGLVNKYNGFDPKLYYLSDWYLVNEIAFNHSFAMIPKPLSHFRIHSSNFSNVFRHNKQIKRSVYKHMLEKLALKENRFYRQQIKKSALLSFLFQDLFWKLLFNPKYISYWPYINKKYPIKKRIKHSLKKKLGLKRAVD